MSTDHEAIKEAISGAIEHTGIKDGVSTFSMKQSDYLSLMKDQGVTEDTVRQVAKANSDISNAAIAVACDKLLEDISLNRVVIKTRKPEGVDEIRYTKQVNTRTPRTGEESVKYGVVSMNLRRKSKVDKDLIERCAAAVEKEVCK